MQHVPPNDARQRGEPLDRRVALATAAAAAAQLQTVATSARFLIVASRRRELKTDGGVTWGVAKRVHELKGCRSMGWEKEREKGIEVGATKHIFNFKAAKTCCKY